MVVRHRFTIAELVARTGVPAATVHHYRRLGLLPPPRRVAPNRFLYDDRHVQGLRLIRLLRERRRLPLAAIRRILPELLSLSEEQAFRPEMWDRAVGLRTHSRRAPATRLLEAAREVFARRGYDEVNVEEICRAARIAKGSFYRHYRSKEDLFFAAAEAAATQAARTFAAAAGPGPLSREAAVTLLAGALSPWLPILLDLLARAHQRRPGYRAAARRALDPLAAEAGRHVPGGGQTVVFGALAAALQDVLQAPASLPTAGRG